MLVRILLGMVVCGLLGTSGLLLTGHGGLAIRLTNYLFPLAFMVFLYKIVKNESK